MITDLALLENEEVEEWIHWIKTVLRIINDLYDPPQPFLN